MSEFGLVTRVKWVMCEKLSFIFRVRCVPLEVGPMCYNVGS